MLGSRYLLPKAARAISILAITLALQSSADGRHRMSDKKSPITPVERSIRSYEAILADVRKTYTMTGGGGISQIREVETDKYMVSLSQEERTDTITYSLTISPTGQVSIIGRTEGTKSYG